jgi:hypothetical protein
MASRAGSGESLSPGYFAGPEQAALSFLGRTTVDDSFKVLAEC